MKKLFNREKKLIEAIARRSNMEVEREKKIHQIQEQNMLKIREKQKYEAEKRRAAQVKKEQK